MIYYLARHTETDWNREGKTQGITNIPLNQNGLAQAQRLAEYFFTHFDNQEFALYSSDLTRALQTALAIQRMKHIHPIIVRKALRELNYGLLEGIQKAEQARLYPELYSMLDKGGEEALRTVFPGGESFADKWRELHYFVQECERKHSEHTIVVSHAGTLRMLRAILTKKDPASLLSPQYGQKHNELLVIDASNAKEVVLTTD